ncbi:hypothetical protein D3C74_422270 [compost metagenome]
MASYGTAHGVVQILNRDFGSLVQVVPLADQATFVVAGQAADPDAGLVLFSHDAGPLREAFHSIEVDPGADSSARKIELKEKTSYRSEE